MAGRELRVRRARLVHGHAMPAWGEPPPGIEDSYHPVGHPVFALAWPACRGARDEWCGVVGVPRGSTLPQHKTLQVRSARVFARASWTRDNGRPNGTDPVTPRAADLTLLVYFPVASNTSASTSLGPRRRCPSCSAVIRFSSAITGISGAAHKE